MFFRNLAGYTTTLFQYLIKHPTQIETHLIEKCLSKTDKVSLFLVSELQ
jgi:hypothetical protein